jgi:hypothetical protein
MLLTLTLAAGLMAAPQSQAEPQRGWVVEVRGYTYHQQVRTRFEPLKAEYHDDLPAFFKQLKMHRQVEAVEAIYVDDLSAYFKQFKKR